MQKRDTSGGRELAQNAFGSLNFTGLPDSPAPAVEQVAGKERKTGKIHLRIEKSGRSGKTVTVLFGPGLDVLTDSQREDMLKSLKNGLGIGGATAGATLELQGDVRTRVAERLKELDRPA